LGVWEGRFGPVPGVVPHPQFQGTTVPGKKKLKKNYILETKKKQKKEFHLKNK